MKKVKWPPSPGEIDDHIEWPIAVFEVDSYPTVVPDVGSCLELYEYGMWDEIVAAFDRAAHPLKIVEREGIVSISKAETAQLDSFAVWARAALIRVFRETRWRRVAAKGADREMIESLDAGQLVEHFFRRFTEISKNSLAGHDLG